MEADSLRPKSDSLKSTTASCDPRSRRCELAQRPRREAERDARQVAIGYIEEASQQGVPASIVAQQLRTPRGRCDIGSLKELEPSRTRAISQNLLGRRTQRSASLSDGREWTHGGIGCLAPLFRTIPRCILENLLRRYRRVWRWRYQQKGFRLTWLRAGTVWAIDFSQAPYPIDGIYKYLFAVRDLASHRQLAWHPFSTETAQETIFVLEDLFRRYGPPLVLKSDNGSAFIAELFTDFLQSLARIAPALSRAHPQYNGALERSNATLKTFTHQHAIHAGHPFLWTSADVDQARQLANTLSRPWGHRGASPEEAWQACAPIHADERQLFLATVDLQRLKTLSERGLDATQELDRKEQASVDRPAISQTLQDLGYLQKTLRCAASQKTETTLARRVGRAQSSMACRRRLQLG